MRKNNPLGFYTFAFIFFLAILSIGNLIQREQSWNLLFAYISAFVSYLFIIQEKESFRLLVGIGILTRISLFFSLPSLSDDIYRFIWDGTLLSNGIHPFDQLPGYYLDQNIPGINNALYEKLNSPQYFTIYPPINQLIFWLSATIGNGNWLVSTNTIRTLLLVADLASLWMIGQILKQLNKSTNLALWLFLNPLLILEFVGNGHFEGFVLFFLLAGIYWFQKSKNMLSASGLGLAIGTKLLPLIYLPAVFLAGLRNKKWHISIIAGFIAVISLLPMLNSSFITGMQNSLNLYFQKFEFNASIYFIAREIGFWLYGYNKIAEIGPLLSILSLLAILGISVFASVKKWSLAKAFLFILFTYLLFATTVHPWYTIPLIAFGILSGYYFTIVWSLMIFVTYLGYSESGFHLSNWLVLLEYLVVSIVLILELRKKIHHNDLKKYLPPFALFLTSFFPSRGQKTFDEKMTSLYRGTVLLIKASELSGKKDIIILDTRSPEEFDVSHIPGATMIDYGSFSKSDVKNVEKDAEVIVYCSVGYRSERIGEKMQKMGFTNVKNLYGGIFDWKNQDKEVLNKNQQPTDRVHTYNKPWSQWLYKGIKVYD